MSTATTEVTSDLIGTLTRRRNASLSQVAAAQQVTQRNLNSGINANDAKEVERAARRELTTLETQLAQALLAQAVVDSSKFEAELTIMNKKFIRSVDDLIAAFEVPKQFHDARLLKQTVVRLESEIERAGTQGRDAVRRLKDLNAAPPVAGSISFSSLGADQRATLVFMRLTQLVDQLQALKLQL